MRILVLSAARVFKEGLRRTDRLADVTVTCFLLTVTDGFGAVILPPIREVLLELTTVVFLGMVIVSGDFMVVCFFRTVTDGFGAVILPPIREVLAVDTAFRELITVGLFQAVTNGF